MPFKPGQSGNPKGRPSKERALTSILEVELGKPITTADGVKVARKRLIAQLMAQIATEGRVTLPNGRELVVNDLKELADILKWIYRHIDGEKTHIDVTSLGESVAKRIEILPVDDDETAE